MKILVTGTAGFIGYHLAQRLIARGDEVVGLDSINNYYDPAVKYARLARTGIAREAIEYNKPVSSTTVDNYQFTQLNFEDKASIDTLFQSQRFDKVCHLAAQAGVRYSLINPQAYIEWHSQRDWKTHSSQTRVFTRQFFSSRHSSSPHEDSSRHSQFT